jgi:hypothetical protein
MSWTSLPLNSLILDVAGALRQLRRPHIPARATPTLQHRVKASRLDLVGGRRRPVRCGSIWDASGPLGCSEVPAESTRAYKLLHRQHQSLSSKAQVMLQARHAY